MTSQYEMRGPKGENEIADSPNNLKVWELLTERLVGRANGSLGEIHEYKKLFLEAYPSVRSLDDINFWHIVRAIVAFEIFAFDASATPFDQLLNGDKEALTYEQTEGAKIFAGK